MYAEAVDLDSQSVAHRVALSHAIRVGRIISRTAQLPIRFCSFREPVVIGKLPTAAHLPYPENLTHVYVQAMDLFAQQVMRIRWSDSAGKENSGAQMLGKIEAAQRIMGGNHPFIRIHYPPDISFPAILQNYMHSLPEVWRLAGGTPPEASWRVKVDWDDGARFVEYFKPPRECAFWNQSIGLTLAWEIVDRFSVFKETDDGFNKQRTSIAFMRLPYDPRELGLLAMRKQEALRIMGIATPWGGRLMRYGLVHTDTLYGFDVFGNPTGMKNYEKQFFILKDIVRKGDCFRLTLVPRDAGEEGKEVTFEYPAYLLSHVFVTMAPDPILVG